MNKIIIGIVSVVILISCGSTQKQNMQVEEYIMSRHDPQDRLIYFFIEKTDSSIDFYSYIFSDIMSENQWTTCLGEFTSEIITSVGKPYPEKWFNKYYPVLIQDDFNGISMAAFTFRRVIDKVYIITQINNIEKDEINFKLFSRKFKINNNPVQYYLIKYNSGEFEINEIERTTMESQLKRTTNYSTQLSKKRQYGFINVQ